MVSRSISKLVAQPEPAASTEGKVRQWYFSLLACFLAKPSPVVVDAAVAVVVDAAVAVVVDAAVAGAAAAADAAVAVVDAAAPAAEDEQDPEEDDLCLSSSSSE